MNNLKSIITFLNKIDIEIIKKGKRIFENENVQFLAKQEGKLIFKCKSESTLDVYDIVIDLENLVQSSCTCPSYSYPYPCKHLTACYISIKNTEILSDDDVVDFAGVEVLEKFPKPVVAKEIEWIPLPQTKINIWQFLSQYSTPDKAKIRKDSHPEVSPRVLFDLTEDKGMVSIKYDTQAAIYDLHFKAVGKQILSQCTCNFESYHNSLCKHKVTALMYFQTEFGEDYFFKLLDFTNEKNELLAEYGLTLNDPESQYFQFLYQNDEIIIQSKNHHIIKPNEWTWLEKTTAKVKEKAKEIELLKDAATLTENIIVLRKYSSYPGFKIDLLPLETGTVSNPTKIGASSLSKTQETLFSIQQLVEEESEFVYNLTTSGITEILEKARSTQNTFWTKSIASIAHLSVEQQNEIGVSMRDGVYTYAEHFNKKGNIYWDETGSGKLTPSKLQQLKFSNEIVTIKIVTRLINNFVEIKIKAVIGGKELDIREENIINNAWLKFDSTIYSLADKNQFSVLWEFKNKEEVLVPKKDMSSLVNKYLLPLKSIVNIDIPEEFQPKKAQGVTFRKGVRLSDLAPDFLLLEAYFSYNDVLALHGTNQLETIVDELPVVIDRDIQEELKHIEYLTTLHPKFSTQIKKGFFYLKFNEALHHNWFFDTLKVLEENNITIYGKEKLELFKYNPNTAKFDLKAGSGIDWFDVKIELSFGEFKVPITDLRKAIIDGQDYVLLSDGSMGVLPQEWIDRLKTIFKIGKTNKDTNSIQLSKLHFTLIDELSDKIDDQEILLELAEKKRRLAEINTNKNYELPKKLKADLRPYQQSGYQWFNLLHDMGWGGCLADDMGLGKTLQAITFIQKRIEDTTVEVDGVLASPIKMLIVGPTSLVYNWENEIIKFAPEINYYIHHGTDRIPLKEALEKDWNVCITSYGTLRNDIEHFMKLTFDVMILDESQAIKNADAQLSKAVKLIPAKQRFIMSGTPVQNNTFDLYAQFDFINPALLGSKEFFKSEFANAIDKNADASKAEQLRKIVFPFLLRRTKETVAKDLPEKIESVIYCEMDKYQRSIYEKVKEEYRTKILQKVNDEGISKTSFLILEGLTKLRMLCDSPSLLRDVNNNAYEAESIKLDELTREIEENISDHKILIFSQFLGMLDLVRQRLEKDNINYLYLDGSTSATDRQQIVSQFQEDKSVQVFLMSLKAGGVGLTLTAADYVYIVDPWWNPAVEDQAIDRTHRIGQDKTIFAYKMICKDSIEEKIIQLQQKKKSIVKELISEDAGFIKKLTHDDLVFLFN